MVIESSLSGEQISEEIRFTLARLEGKKPMIYVPLDPSATVVLFADLQAGIIERVKTNELTHLRRAVSALAKLTKLFDIPAVLTTAPSEGGAPRVTPEIAAALGELPQYMRTTTDAFLHTATRDAITRTGRKTLIIAGVATEIIVQRAAKILFCPFDISAAKYARVFGWTSGDEAISEGDIHRKSAC
jgi:nicotinamidase-related amidase